MNERTRELARQAGFETEHHKWIFANDNVGEGECHELLEKFAELIVRECAKICDDIGRQARKDWKAKYDPVDDGRCNGAWECEESIKEYFGVEI